MLQEEFIRGFLKKIKKHHYANKRYVGQNNGKINIKKGFH